jgi:recombination protein RecA
MDEGRRSMLDKALGDIVKRYGDGSIMRLGEAHKMTIDAIPTGSLSLDLALGIGGIPRGRITEIYGPESSGKTTLCQHIVAEVDNLLVSQPDTGEQALEITETLVRSGAVDLVVIDSVAALVPRSEIEGDMGDAQMGAMARLMSQALRKLSGAINQTKTSVIFTNQLRMKIGVMFGNPETTTGGNALKFYASVRLDVRRIQSIKIGAEIVGNRTRVRVVKNKVAPPFRTAEFDIMYNEGISKVGDLIDLATQLEIVDKRGAFFSYGETRLGQGRENSKEFLRQNPDIANEIEQVIRQRANGGEVAIPLVAGSGEDSGDDATEEA